MASTSRSTFTASQVCQLLCDESGNEIDAASDIEIQVFISDLVSSLTWRVYIIHDNMSTCHKLRRVCQTGVRLLPRVTTPIARRSEHNMAYVLCKL